jgi:hypothetical protein
MTMTAKFAGTCKRCNGRIMAGDVIAWSKGYGATHAYAATCQQELDRAAARAVAPAPAYVAPVAVNMAAVVALLTQARERGLKAPKARFRAPGGGELRLSLAGGETKYPGAVQVKLDGAWIGRVNVDGTLAGYALTSDPAMQAALVAIASAPAEAAKAYAALAGRCSFCSLPLTDAGSVEAGYGPICAKKYGLPHEALGTPHVVAA